MRLVDKILSESNLKPRVEDIIKNELPNIERLECDGATRVLDYVLSANNIPHTCFAGSLVKNAEAVIPLHYWIQLGDGRIVDYKAQMWIGKTGPNGIFKPEQYKKYTYEGKPIHLNTHHTIYKILTM